jgi:predicted DNA-binding antitoxin AbrB/MazE fold protein
MAETVWAVYENGKLRLLEPVHLREGERVRIRVVGAEPKDAPRLLQEEQQAYAVVVEDEAELGQNELAATAEPKKPIKALIQKLIREGQLRPRPSGSIPPDPVSEQERLELADILRQAPGKPLSEIVIEERGKSGYELTFVCADVRLLDIARTEGLLTENPNDHH